MNKSSVYKLINTNELPAIKGLGTTKIKSENLEKLLDSYYKENSTNE